MRDIAEIPPGHRRAVSILLQAGVVGWTERSGTAYMNYALLSTLIGTVQGIAGGRPKRTLRPDEISPFVDLMSRRGQDRVGSRMLQAVEELRRA